ncbi:protein kinase [Mycobacterium bourgelatii]|nr:protein kinase [Mycobacterium bourgelatii]
MGEVWRAFDTETNRVVAVKVLPAQLAVDPMFGERFRREANAAAGLNNPHVIPIHHFGEIDGRLYVDMRLVEGRDLQEVLRQGPLESARAVAIVEQVASALHAAHRIGLVHRDVKPSNVLLDDEDFAYLIDFGIARSTDETGLTGTGNIIGTWAYLAPERISAGQLDPRSDVYALACVLHECLTGQQPYPASSLEQQISAHLTSPPPRPSQLRAGVPAQLDAVIAAGMAKDPDQRYATTKELARAAREAIAVPTAPGPVARPEPALQPPPRRAPASPPTATAPAPRPPAPYQTRARPRPVPPAPQIHTVPVSRAPVLDKPPEAEPPGDNPPWWRRKVVIILAVMIVAVAITVGIWSTVGSTGSTGNSQGQVALPIKCANDLGRGLAVDTAGAVYIACSDNSGVFKLSAGTNGPVKLPFPGGDFRGVAVDTKGAVYAICDSRVYRLPAGARTAIELPFGGLDNPWGLAVDTAGAVYVAESGKNRVLKLVSGTPVELPFWDLNKPVSVAVDTAGAVYVTDLDARLFQLPRGASTAVDVTPAPSAISMAVDTGDRIYFISGGVNQRVFKLSANSSVPLELPFDGLYNPSNIAVDNAGAVYVTDDSHRVLKLTVG